MTWRPLGATLAIAVACIACVEPRLTHCPTVDCPKGTICDGRGGCALPQQVEACVMKDDGAPCSYPGVDDGACSDGLCLPLGCGNNIQTSDEVCDDGNTTNGDGCSADCRSDETCTNAIVDPASGEQCDDGNTVDGDGCQANCQAARCGDGIRDELLAEQCDAGGANSNAPDAPCRPTCQLPRCGDGTQDTAEQCDDGNVASGDGCSGDCRSNEVCGNGVIDASKGEVCDDGNTMSGDGCKDDCTSLEVCGNGVLDTARGEVCDDGNVVSGDGCSSDCKSLEVCGNAIVDTIDEQCDLGTATNSDAPNAMCRTNCKLPRCGDGIFDDQLGEACDDGSANSTLPNAACRPSCQPRRCGDTIHDTLVEACDDGNSVAGDGCSPDCASIEVCGNGIVDVAAGEQCDDGNASNADGCHTDCQIPRCGDGILDTGFGEACDQGAMNSNDPGAACRLDCQPQRCGDGITDPTAGEVCDDANSTPGDGCAPDCRSNETCGNGVVDAVTGEQCDLGAGVNADTPNAMCRTTCRLPRCGDGIFDDQLGEGCDDGAANSTAANAACRPSCQPRRCGDGVRDDLFAEVCDDGNSTAGDGCSPDCASNETCGNAYIDVAKGEQCDDGNAGDDDSCHTDCKIPQCGDGIIDPLFGEACDQGAANSSDPDAVCRLNCQPRRCGDAVRDPAAGEVCDDGNSTAGDGCSPDCASNETCGNAIVDTAKGEQCDDGNASDADNCHTDCKIPRCGDGIVDTLFNEQCDAGAANSTAPNAPCRPTCQLPRCGDTVIDTALGEVCDDGNSIAGDGCRPDCISNETCGNGQLDAHVSEQCDDGNTIGRDGCSACKNEDAVVVVPGGAPGVRERTAIAYDAARQRIVMFGGQPAANVYFGDTWEWDGVSWTQMRPRLSPQPRANAAIAYDANRKRVVMFGGRNNAFRNDTWEWDGVEWKELSPATSPSPRIDAAMAYDASRKKIVLYGGDTSTNNSSPLSDTWEWNGTTWTQLSPAANAGVRAGHVMAYDAVRRQIVLRGGDTSTSSGVSGNGRTFAWDGTTWLDRGNNTSAPQGYRLAMAFDPIRARTVIAASGTDVTWEWDGAAWTSIAGTSPPTRTDTFAAYDVARRQLLLHGGFDGARLGDTWVRTGTTWAQPAAFVQPPARFRTFASYDPVRRRTVMFGGAGTGSPGSGAGTWSRTNDTWEWDGRRWTSIGAGDPPPAQTGLLADYRVATRATIMMGGEIAISGPNDPTNANLYSFNGMTWTQLATREPSPRSACMAYDVATDGVIAFGGGSPTTNQTWRWTAAAGWTQLAPATSPPARRNCALAYDRARGRIVLYGGISDAFVPFGDVWEWDGSTWTDRTPATGLAPSARDAHALVYNPDRRQIAVFGHSGNNTEDLWEWNGTQWTQRTLVTTVPDKYRPALAYDAVAHGFVAFGGRNESFVATGTTELIRYRSYVAAEACTSSQIDYDGDGKAGCADEECWSSCTPLCPPGTSCPAGLPRCGDGTCNTALEDCRLCPGDCGACTGGVCGDFHCNGTESAATCPNDC